MHVVLGDGREASFRAADFSYYHACIRERFEAYCGGETRSPYPEPCGHCEYCHWQDRCQEQWEEDDHLTPTEQADTPLTLEKIFNRDNWEGFLVFKFGDSFYRNRSVLALIKEKLPVSVSLGVSSFFMTYIICIVLGIGKAVKSGTRFDTMTSVIVLIGYSIPGFVMGIFLIVLIGPGDGAVAHPIPLAGLTSAGTPGYDEWSLVKKIIDYLHHLAAPLFCFVLGGFATLTMLTKNAVLEEMQKQYVITARAKGLSEKIILFKHILKNALIPLVTGFPIGFLTMFFSGSLLIEQIFTLDGFGLLSFQAVIQRDYPIVLGSMFIFSLIALLGQLLTDLSYVLIDRRISFDESQG